MLDVRCWMLDAVPAHNSLCGINKVNKMIFKNHYLI